MLGLGLLAGASPVSHRTLGSLCLFSCFWAQCLGWTADPKPFTLLAPRRPVRVVPDPIRGAPHVLVMCEVFAPDGACPRAHACAHEFVCAGVCACACARARTRCCTPVCSSMVLGCGFGCGWTLWVCVHGRRPGCGIPLTISPLAWHCMSPQASPTPATHVPSCASSSHPRPWSRTAGACIPARPDCPSPVARWEHQTHELLLVGHGRPCQARLLLAAGHRALLSLSLGHGLGRTPSQARCLALLGIGAWCC